jgi:hypothetical protein
MEKRKNILELLKSNSKKVAKVLAIIATTLMVEKLVKGNWGLLLVFMALAAVITLVVSNWKAIIAMMPEKKNRKKLSKRAIVVLLLIISLFGIAAVYKNFSGSRKTPAPIVDAEFNDSDNNTNKNDSNNENANNGSSNAPTTSFGYGNGQRFATGDQILNQSKDNTITETKTEKETNKVSLPGNEKSADQIVKELEDKGEHVVVFEDDIIGIGADKETVTPSAEVTDEEDLVIKDNSDVDSFENHEANTTISTEENADMADADDDETSKMIEEARKNQAKEVTLTDDVNDEIKDDAKEENDLVLTTEPEKLDQEVKGFDSVETIEEDTTETVVETAEVEKVTFAGNTNIVKVYVGENGQIIFNESVASIDMDGAQINGNVVTTPVFDEATVGEYTATSVSGQTFTFTFVASSILN